MIARDWLPPGKRAAVCFSIDDIHPARSTDPYEAGGDLGAGALGRVEWLLERHPRLRVTLFTTPDWREIAALPTRTLLARIPYVRDRVYLSRIWPPGRMRLDRHPEFVRYLAGLPRTEIALHGLHHVHRGPRIPVEFQEQGVEECRAMLREAMRIFRQAGLPFAPGMAPPSFSAPPALLQAMADEGLTFVAASRDIRTPVAAGALNSMSGLSGVSLLYPEWVQDGRLLHIGSNFQATSEIDRAHQVIGLGGLLSIKAHIIVRGVNRTMLDGLGDLYRNYLDVLFTELEDRYGEDLWWTTMGEIAARAVGARDT